MTRGALVESRHEVFACAVDARDRVVFACGDTERPVFVRSAAKPFIAAEIVRSGTAAWFDLDDRELAVIAASHNGEPFHVAAVESILAKIGLGPEALQCGAHPPAYDPAAAALAAAGRPFTALHNNCSGKHAGILALCVHAGYDVREYLAADHPAQVRILAFCARVAGAEVESMPLGIDGCGIPVYALPLRVLARSFARLAVLDGLADDELAALERVRGAMLANPAYVAGTGRLDTAIMEATGGAVACKAGAEGVHGDALLGAGVGLALKVSDGTRRGAPPAAVALLERLGALDPSARARLEPFAVTEVRNVAGRVVGKIACEADTIPDSEPS